MSLLSALVHRLRGRFLEMPVQALDRRWSVVSSAEDLAPKPGDDLIRLMLAAARRAQSIHLGDVVGRMSTREQRSWLTCWPGEHYQLLAGLVEELKPQRVVEIGTWQGMGALSLADRLPTGGKVITYDIIPWNQIPQSSLRSEDFASGSIEQRLGDLADPEFFERELPTLRQADLIFLDAPKDGVSSKPLSSCSSPRCPTGDGYLSSMT
jgi:predicted O-methyltransferase YrrM